MALAPDGTVNGVRVVELTEETYVWVKPLIDGTFTQQLARAPAGRGPSRVAVPGGDPMSEFDAGVISNLVQRAAALFDAAVQRGS